MTGQTMVTAFAVALGVMAGCSTDGNADAGAESAPGDAGAAGKAAAAVEQRIELGQIRWGRDLDAAKAASKKSGKPVLVLFQEVPGCLTCQNFGRVVLRHPLLVEAAESAFEPVLVYNNRKGWDADVLRSFNEPSWNNPVVRYLDSDGRDLVKSLLASAQSMRCATTVFAHDDKQLAIAKEKVGNRAVRLNGEARDASGSDQLHTLRATSYRYVAMTAMQSMKVNAALAARDIAAAHRWLSPRQIEQHSRIAAALRDDRDALAGLNRPAGPRALADYAAQLEAKLATR